MQSEAITLTLHALSNNKSLLSLAVKNDGGQVAKRFTDSKPEANAVEGWMRGRDLEREVSPMPLYR